MKSVDKIKLTKEDRAAVIARLVELEADIKITSRTSGAKLLEALAIAEDDDADLRNMANVLKKYRPGYAISITASGRKSRYNGDEVAVTLEGLEAAHVVKVAEKVIPGIKRGELTAKYDGMGEGHKRMNAGNRIRGAINRGDIVIAEVEKAIKGK